MTDWYTELWVPLRDWGLANPDKAIGTAFLVVGAPFVGWVWWRKNMRAKPEAPPPLEVKLETPAMPVTLEAPTPQIDTMTLNIETYEAQVRARIEAAQRMWEKAEGTEKESLGQQIGELQGRLENIEPAFDAAKARIVELEKLLEREGNQIGAERLERAENALAAGDFDEADALLAEISAEEDLAVQRKARAEYGRGQIAEEQVRWHDAAKHYGDAARFNRNYDYLDKAHEFAWKAGEYSGGINLGEQKLEAALKECGEDSEEHSKAINDLAVLYQLAGHHEKAEPLFREAIRIDKATIGEGHPSYAIHLNNLAGLLRDMGRYEEAEPLYREAIRIGKATLGEGHPSYAIRLNNLAGLLRDMGRFEEAEPLFREAIRIGEATIGEGHPSYAIRLNNLANLLRDMGRLEEARPLWEQMHAIHLKALGLDHPQTKKGAANYAKLLRKHFPDDPALAELEATFGPDIGKE